MISIKKVWFDHDQLFVELNDDRIIGTPINWYPNLRKGTLSQIQNYEIKGEGTYIHWPELDEDLSAEGFLTFSKETITV
jgi:hypothetical protein